eukprot:4422863-Amphidinium_carterae.1
MITKLLVLRNLPFNAIEDALAKSRSVAIANWAGDLPQQTDITRHALHELNLPGILICNRY